MPIASEIKVRRRISTLLFIVLTSIAGLVLLGLVVMTVRLVEIQDDLGTLRDSALPRLVKLSQLSQEAAATISMAVANIFFLSPLFNAVYQRLPSLVASAVGSPLSSFGIRPYISA